MGNFGRFFRHAGCQWEERRGEEREWGRLADRRLKEMRLVGEVRGTDCGVQRKWTWTLISEDSGREEEGKRGLRGLRGLPENPLMGAETDGDLACRFGTAAKPKEAIIAGGASRTHFTRIVLYSYFNICK